jgi:hypothetical protein
MGDESSVKRTRPSVYLYRAASAHVVAHVKGVKPERIVKDLFPDPVTDFVIRTAAGQATTGTPSWAGALGQQVVDDSVQAIATLSAAAGLIQRGMKIDFGHLASIRVPGRLLDANDAGQWVGEGKPIVVRSQRMTTGPTLTPHKLVVITSYTVEMTQQSNIEAVSRALIQEASALALDKAMFGAQAEDGITPGGLLNGVTPITAATGGGEAAMATDIGKLVAALVAANGGRDVVLIMNPTQATTLSLLASPRFSIPILQSSSVAVGTIIAVEASSFVSAFDAMPEFLVATAPMLHYEDTSPADPIMGGTPVRSWFQTDSVGLRMQLKAHWGMRAAHVAVVNGATW